VKGAQRPRPLQDEATRAWNLHTALYYKAGGTPWRMPRHSSDLATCYVDVSFYRTPDGDELHTAVAQVFNERGDGVVVRGGTAKISKSDRQPHLGETDARKPLTDALAEYRRIHGHQPARVVLHKSSDFNPKRSPGSKRRPTSGRSASSSCSGSSGVAHRACSAPANCRPCAAPQCSWTRAPCCCTHAGQYPTSAPTQVCMSRNPSSFDRRRTPQTSSRQPPMCSPCRK
jgi:hypothetical protein